MAESVPYGNKVCPWDIDRRTLVDSSSSWCTAVEVVGEQVDENDSSSRGHSEDSEEESSSSSSSRRVSCELFLSSCWWIPDLNRETDTRRTAAQIEMRRTTIRWAFVFQPLNEMSFRVGFRFDVVQHLVTIGSETEWSSANLFHCNRSRRVTVFVGYLTFRSATDQHFPRGKR
jgi:hypothetical protein